MLLILHYACIHLDNAVLEPRVPYQAEEGKHDDDDDKAAQQHRKEEPEDHAHDDKCILEWIHNHADPCGVIIEVPECAVVGGARAKVYVLLGS